MNNFEMIRITPENNLLFPQTEGVVRILDSLSETERTEAIRATEIAHDWVRAYDAIESDEKTTLEAISSKYKFNGLPQDLLIFLDSQIRVSTPRAWMAYKALYFQKDLTWGELVKHSKNCDGACQKRMHFVGTFLIDERFLGIYIMEDSLVEVYGERTLSELMQDDEFIQKVSDSNVLDAWIRYEYNTSAPSMNPLVTSISVGKWENYGQGKIINGYTNLMELDL